LANKEARNGAATPRCDENVGISRACFQLLISSNLFAVEVLAVTIFLSLLLAVFFVVLFLGSQRRTRHSIEQDALLPLDEGRSPIKPGKPGPR
jgi:hypothetical protein